MTFVEIGSTIRDRRLARHHFPERLDAADRRIFQIALLGFARLIRQEFVQRL